MSYGVRRSRHIVKFDADGGGWHVRDSVDENSTPHHVLKKIPLQEPLAWPPPPRLILTVSPKGTRKRVEKEVGVEAVLVRPTRVPLVPVDTQTLVNEVRLLEFQLKHANRQICVQNRLIDGFCKLKIP